MKFNLHFSNNNNRNTESFQMGELYYENSGAESVPIKFKNNLTYLWYPNYFHT